MNKKNILFLALAALSVSSAVFGMEKNESDEEFVRNYKYHRSIISTIDYFWEEKIKSIEKKCGTLDVTGGLRKYFNDCRTILKYLADTGPLSKLKFAPNQEKEVKKIEKPEVFIDGTIEYVTERLCEVCVESWKSDSSEKDFQDGQFENLVFCLRILKMKDLDIAQILIDMKKDMKETSKKKALQ